MGEAKAVPGVEAQHQQLVRCRPAAARREMIGGRRHVPAQEAWAGQRSDGGGRVGGVG